jgi:prolyl-tRNA synthetase
MRASRFLLPTAKEAPADATVASHVLMMRAGMIRRVAAGIYTILPLGLRVLRKVERIVREELDRVGCLEVNMPMVIPAELWSESGRWDFYGPELLRLKDRKGGDFCLGPTHEEVITSLAGSEIKSYRQLPLNLYQVQTKFRDEIRPRFGLMRGREFVMKDAYSFDLDADGARESYWQMHEVYSRIFARCGVNFAPVEADTGNIGGSLSHEFQVIADTGEDALATCPGCGYAANVEKAQLAAPAASDASIDGAPEAVQTPKVGTIAEVSAFMNVPADRFIKALVFETEGEPVMALMRGDRDLNEPKLRVVLGVEELRPATPETVVRVTQAPAGFVGPVGLSSTRIIADHEVMALSDAVCGANVADQHLTGVQPGRDFTAEVADLRIADEGDACGRCGSGKLSLRRGIEVGHIFYLGTKYSTAMNATVLDTNGKTTPLEMGCYGIGIGRTAAACIEQNHDEQGICWPVPLAPFEVHLLALGKQDEVLEACSGLYQQLTDAGLEVLFDDRPERPGFKFKDAELIGLPWRVALGKRGVESGTVEIVERASGERFDLNNDELVAFLTERIVPARRGALA